MTLGGVGGGNWNSWRKWEIGVIFILGIGDRILMKLDIYRRILCLRCSLFDSNCIWGHRGLEEGNRNLGKRFEWRDQNET